MAIKHDKGSYKVYLDAKFLAERAHIVAILESREQDSSYERGCLIRDYQELRESLYKAGWI